MPDKVADVPKFIKTAGAMDFNWGEDTGSLVSALFLFLYLDFIGSSITFLSLGQVGHGALVSSSAAGGPPPAGRAASDAMPPAGERALRCSLRVFRPPHPNRRAQMAGLINKKGDMPRANIAFLADAIGSMLGGLLGSSALTTYVESASAMREGGKTGFTAVICSLFFFASCFMSPLFRCVAGGGTEETRSALDAA